MACWTGDSPSAFETTLLKPLPSYALEQLRLRFLFAVTTNHAPVKSARAVVQMAFDTEIGAVLRKVVDVSPGVLASTVCERRRYIDVDGDMRLFRFMLEPALTEFETSNVAPLMYIEFLRKYLKSEHPRYRMGALAVFMCLATVYYQ